jgi:hypothetical protein
MAMESCPIVLGKFAEPDLIFLNLVQYIKKKYKKTKEKNKIKINFFLKYKNKYTLIRKFNPTLNEKNYHHSICVQYKKVTSIYFFFMI